MPLLKVESPLRFNVNLQPKEELVMQKVIVIALFTVASLSVLSPAGAQAPAPTPGQDARKDTRDIRQDRREIREDRRKVREAAKAGDKDAAKSATKELRADRKDLNADKRDRRQDVRAARK